jgi:hypothetical protein
MLALTAEKKQTEIGQLAFFIYRHMTGAGSPLLEFQK